VQRAGLADGAIIEIVFGTGPQELAVVGKLVSDT
jgi:hypothetical protein